VMRMRLRERDGENRNISPIPPKQIHIELPRILSSQKTAPCKPRIQDTKSTRLPSPPPNPRTSPPPPTLPPFHPATVPATPHLPIPPPLLCRIIRLQQSALTLIRLTKRIPPLFPHTLHLPDLPDRLLELLHAGTVVLDVILLYLLDVMVRLRAVHALCVFPAKVAQEREDGDDKGHEVEDWRRKEARDDGVVFGGKPQLGRHGRVDRDESEPDDHAAGDGEECVFGPDIRNKGGFAEHDTKHRGVKCGAPDPVAGDFAVALGQVPVPDQFGNKIGDEGVVEAVEDPGKEGVHFKEDTFLAELVELGIAVEEAGGDELVEDAQDEGGEDGEEDVVEGERPGFENDLAGKGVLKGILLLSVRGRVLFSMRK